MNKSNRRILLVIGPLLMILCTVLLPAAIFETLESSHRNRCMDGVLVDYRTG